MKKFLNFLILLLILGGLVFSFNKLLNNRYGDGQVEELDRDGLEDREDASEEDGKDQEEEDPIEEDPLADTAFLNDEGVLVVSNTDDILVLVNKKRNLPGDYIPDDLLVPKVRFSFDGVVEKSHLRKEAGEALEEMFKAAEEEGIFLFAVSGYRSYDRQKTLFDNKKKQVGEEEARQVVAYPGQSEHQTGLTIDISAQSVGFSLEESFGQSQEGIWVRENAHRFGYIIRYQEDTSHITGYSFEPWHIRYVGREAAGQIFERNITLEEYLGDI